LPAFDASHEDDIQVTRDAVSQTVDLAVPEREPTELGQEGSIVIRQGTDFSLSFSDGPRRRAYT
jgi:hypothetical protein